MQFTIGCTTRPHSALPFPEACERIARSGYRHVAVFGSQGTVPVNPDSTPAELRAVKEAVASAGLTPSMVIGSTSLQLGLDEATERYKRLIDNVAEVGGEWLLDCGVGDESKFDDYFELMRRAAPHAAAAGVGITMKPHGGISLTPEHLVHAYRTVGHPAFSICYDPGNIIYYTKGERLPEQGIDAVVPLTSTVIIKDCVVEDDKPDVQVTPGDGLVDFPVVLRALVAGGFNGPFYVECVGSSEPDAVDRDEAFTLGYITGILEAVAPA